MYQYRRFCSIAHGVCQYGRAGGLCQHGIDVVRLAIPDAYCRCRLHLHAAAPSVNILSISASG